MYGRTQTYHSLVLATWIHEVSAPELRDMSTTEESMIFSRIFHRHVSAACVSINFLRLLVARIMGLIWEEKSRDEETEGERVQR